MSIQYTTQPSARRVGKSLLSVFMIAFASIIAVVASVGDTTMLANLAMAPQ